MEEPVIPSEFNNHPVIEPTVKAFIKLLAEIAYRSEQSEKEAKKRVMILASSHNREHHKEMVRFFGKYGLFPSSNKIICK